MRPDERMAMFHTWAPDESPWSAWAKPILFATDSGRRVPYAIDVPPKLDAVPRSTARTAIIVDLPAQHGVLCAIELARRGYRPVPMYNATSGPGSNLIDIAPIMSPLADGADVIRGCRIPPDAPPAFMLDGARTRAKPLSGQYDNRWIIFPQDFPSARVLRLHGIEQVLLIRYPSRLPTDLRAVLRPWHDAGIHLSSMDPHTGVQIPIDPRVFSTTSRLFDHLSLVFHGLRENSAGGFGGTVPDPSSGSGGHGFA